MPEQLTSIVCTRNPGINDSSAGPSYQGMRLLRLATLSPSRADTGIDVIDCCDVSGVTSPIVAFDSPTSANP